MITNKSGGAMAPLAPLVPPPMMSYLQEKAHHEYRSASITKQIMENLKTTKEMNDLTRCNHWDKHIKLIQDIITFDKFYEVRN